MKTSITRRTDCTIFSFRDNVGSYNEISVRNVGDKNTEAQIQIDAEKRKESRRGQYFSISIPADIAKEFIAACSTPDTQLPIS